MPDTTALSLVYHLSDCDDEESRHGWNDGQDGVSLWPTDDPDPIKASLRALPLIAFALQMHIQCCAIFAIMPSALQTNAPKRRGVAFSAVALILLLYFPVGIGGLIRFGSATQQDILTNFGVSDTLADVARVCIVLTAFAAYPSQHFPARTVIHKLVVQCTSSPDLSSGLPGDELVPAPAGGISLRFAILEALVWNSVVLGVTIFAVLNNIKLDVVFQLIGSLCGSAVILIIPGMLWARLAPGTPSSPGRVLPAALLITVGLFIMVAGTFVTLSALGDTPPSPPPPNAPPPAPLLK